MESTPGAQLLQGLSSTNENSTIFDDLMHLQQVGRLEIDLRESYETLYNV
jgi:hypothetical protein